MTPRLAGHLAMALFAILIAGSFSLGKLATPFIGPGPLNAARFVLASFVMGFIAFGWKKHPITMPTKPWRFAVFGGILAIYFITMFMALEITSPVAASAVFTLTPIMSALAAYFLLKQVSRPIVAFSLAFAAFGSVWVIFRGDFNAVMSFNVGPGEKVFFIGSLAYAFYAPLFKKWRGSEPLLTQTFWALLVATLWLVIVSGAEIIKTDWLALPVIAWIAIIYLAIFTTALTNLLLQFAALHLPSAKVMAYVYLTPVIVILIEGASGNGWVSISVWLGVMAIMIGLLMLFFTKDN